MVEFIRHLKEQLAEDLPGEDAQFRMAPTARPRPAESAAADVRWRQSAVLLYLFPDRDDWRIVLMKRTDHDGPHGGQISIPGGRLERGEDHRQAALREFAEEIGVAVSDGQVIGGLSELFIPVSRFLVKPFVAFAVERPEYDPDPVEVDGIIEVPLTQLANGSLEKIGSTRIGDGPNANTPYLDVDGHVVWGATAMILSEFRAVLRSLPRGHD